MAFAATAAGCSGSSTLFNSGNQGGWFSKPIDVFAKPDWARPADQNTAQLGPQGPVAPENLVNPDGSCAPAPSETPQAAAPASEAAPAADRPVGSMAGDLAGAPMPAAAPGALEPGAPPVLGGIALEMSECQAVRRAGQPSNVSISVGGKGERKVVLTYLSGPWPGIYTFASGRLKEIDRAPEQPKTKKAPPKKKKPLKRAKSAARQGAERTYVQ
jgi:hypothetical protein